MTAYNGTAALNCGTAGSLGRRPGHGWPGKAQGCAAGFLLAVSHFLRARVRVILPSCAWAVLGGCRA